MVEVGIQLTYRKLSKNKKGLFVGDSHADGGIPSEVVETKQKIEIEGDEYYICREAYNSPKKFSFENKTNKEILDFLYTEFSCKLVQAKMNAGDFIVCKVVVLDKSKHSRQGTVKDILNEMQGEKACRVENGSSHKKDGGIITYGQKLSGKEIKKFYSDVEENSFLDFVRDDDQYVLKKVDVQKIIDNRRDASLQDFINSEYVKVDVEWHNSLPILIGNTDYDKSVVLDGYHRVKRSLLNNTPKITAFVIENPEAFFNLEDGGKLYHVSNKEISKKNQPMHFGTLKQAEARCDALNYGNDAIYYSCDLNPDWKVLSTSDVVANKIAQNCPENFEYDAIKYPNAIEGEGYSYVIISDVKLNRLGIPSEHREAIERPLEIFDDFDLSEYYDSNYSNRTQEEIEYLKQVDDDRDFVLEHDQLFKNYESYLESKGKNFDKSEVNRIKNELDTIIYRLKYHYNRERPHDISDLDYIYLESAQSPSYPSGHSLQSRFFAHYFSDLYPEHREDFFELAENTGKSRIVAKVHYPTDHILGKKLADNLYRHYDTKTMKKGGFVSWKDKYNKKYGYSKGESHDLDEIAKDTGISKKGLQKIYNKGVGARKTNPESVRSVKDGKKRGGKSLRGKMSAEQWAMARVYSAVMGGKASKVDKKELKMENGGNTDEQNAKNSFVTYRLKNQKGKGYNGLYKKLFNLLNKDALFSECYDENSYYDGNDMIVTCSWGLEGDLPKGITEVDKFAKGGMVDLFEKYEQQPANVRAIYDKYQDKIIDGDFDYADSADFLKEMESEGYTFEYGLDNEPYGLRPINVPLNQLEGYEQYDKGGAIRIAFYEKDKGKPFSTEYFDDEEEALERYEKILKEFESNPDDSVQVKYETMFKKGGRLTDKNDKYYLLYEYDRKGKLVANSPKAVSFDTTMKDWEHYQSQNDLYEVIAYPSRRKKSEHPTKIELWEGKRKLQEYILSTLREKGGELKVGDTVKWKYGNEHKVKEIYPDNSKIGQKNEWGTMVLLSNGQYVNIAEVTKQMAQGGDIGISEVYEVDGKDYLFSTPLQNAKGEYTGWGAYEVVYDVIDGEKHLNYEKTKRKKRQYFTNEVKRKKVDDYFAEGGEIKTNYYSGALAFLNW